MRKTTLILTIALNATLLTLCALSPMARSDPSLTPPSTLTLHTTHATHEQDPETLRDRHDLEVVRLALHLERVLGSWSPAVREVGTVALPELARDLAAAALDLGSPRFEGDAAGARAGILLGALAYFEGARFARYVDDGSCNDDSWRADPVGRWTMRNWGDCDHGHAYSLFQIHAGDLYLGDHCPLFGSPEHVTGEKLRDRGYAARLALCIAHRSLTASGTLSGYTGEDSRDCPKADARLNFAVDQAEKHPLSPLP